MLVRDFKRAAELFLSSVATFTCTELMTYKDLVFYAVTMGLVSKERPVIKKDIVQSPEVLAIIKEVPHLK